MVFKKGHQTWNKGKKGIFSKEALIKISLASKGIKRSDETRLKMSLARIGKHLSEEAKRKNSEAHKGKHHTEEWKQKIRNNAKINTNFGMKGKHMSEEAKQKLSKLHKGYKYSDETKRKLSMIRKGSNNSFYGKSHSEEARKLMSEAAKIRMQTRIMPSQDTSIELKLQSFLTQLGIEFFTHQYMKEIIHAYRCDIWVPSLNLVIEADGDYFHGNLNKYPNLKEWQIKQKELDEKRTQELKEKGYKVLRLWEHEINLMQSPKELQDRFF